MKKPEKKCPECKGPMEWKVVHSLLGAPSTTVFCSKCNLVGTGREAPQVAEGKELERSGKINGKPIKDMAAMDKRITRLPCDVQIGILRERQKDL